MIRPLRQRHRLMISALSLIIPTAFVLGVATRKEIPVSPVTQPNAAPELNNYTEIWNRSDLWENSAIRTRILKSSSNPSQFAVELTSLKQIIRPELLVYWVPDAVQFSDSLPDNAFLLGTFNQSAPTHFALPNQATIQPGSLILYSLADHKYIAVSKSFKTQ